METHPCTPQLMQQGGQYQVLNIQYSYPVHQLHQQQQQQQQQPQTQPFNKQKPTLQVIPIQIASTLNAANTVTVISTENERQAFPSGGNTLSGNGAYLFNNNCYMPQSNVNPDALNHGIGYLTNNNVGQVHAVQTFIPETGTPHINQLHVNIQGNETLGESVGGINVSSNNFQPGYGLLKPPEHNINGIIKIPEPTQVKLNADQSKNIGHLNIQVAGAFVSWNISGKTVLDLNFMRSLFYITKLDLAFHSNTPYEKGLCEGLHKLVRNKVLSDWLMLKCEEKLIPFFKVSNQVQIFCVNNFSTLLSVIAQESCLPLPFITKEGAKINYYFINFPKSTNDKVKKLNVPIFHDADNGRKKIPCKHPGIRLDCSFESTIQEFKIHADNGLLSVFSCHMSFIRQVLIYNHIVWGFLQAWLRRVREHYNGCFKIQDIAQNLCLCQSEPSQTANIPSEEGELVYYIDYSNFYIKFDPVGMKDMTVVLKIENFETNYVCDVSVVQYYRQFFLINDLHYSDALKNIVLFGEKNGASKVADFMYMQPKDNSADRFNKGFYPPGGISRSSEVQPTNTTEKDLAKPDAPAQPVFNSTNPTTEGFNLQTDVLSLPATEIRQHSNGTTNNSQITINSEQGQNVPAKPSELLTKPLIKTRTVEEINSSIESSRGLEVLGVSFESTISEPKKVNQTRLMNLTLKNCIRQIVNDCFARNQSQISVRDLTADQNIAQRIFSRALNEAMKMDKIETFVEKLYVTLQKSFTNATSQRIVYRTISRALTMKFPNLKSLLIEHPNVPPRSKGWVALQKINECPSGVKLSAPQLNQGLIILKEYENLPVAPQIELRSPETRPQSQPTSFEISSSVDHSYTKSPTKQIDQSETNDQSDMSVDSVSDPNIMPERVCSPSVIQTHFNYKNKKTREARKSAERTLRSCTKYGESVIRTHCNRKNKEASEERKSCDRTLRSFKTYEKPVIDDGFTSEVDAIVTETKDSISINLTLPVEDMCEVIYDSETSEEKAAAIQSMPKADPSISIGDAVTERTQGSSCENGEERNGGSIRSSVPHKTPQLLQTAVQENLFARFNIKPCSVLLNANDVASYQRRWKGLRERRDVCYNVALEFSDESSDATDSDSNDDNFVLRYRSSRKRQKGVSDLEFMEARTRVLERLRKRNQMYVPSRSGPRVYTSNEIDGFLVDDSAAEGSRSLPDEESEDEKNYKALCQECLTRKAEVVLVRLEETFGIHEDKDRWKITTNANGRLTLSRDQDYKYEDIPEDKKQFFELREGKLYLKEQYQVKNGKIVRVNSDTGDNRKRLKREGTSPQEESNFLPNFIKEENSPE